MSLPEFFMLSLALWFGLSCLGAAVWSLAASCRRPSPPPPPDPDATADDWDDDDVARIVELPPVPLPEVWTESDEAMLAWYCAGQADR